MRYFGMHESIWFNLPSLAFKWACLWQFLNSSLWVHWWNFRSKWLDDMRNRGIDILLKWSTFAAAAKSLQSCPTLCDPIDGRQPIRLPRPWDSPGKNTGVGCHFLLQCMKVKSKSEVAQSCPTLRDPMDCSLPGSSVYGIFQARVLEWGAIAFSGIPLGWIKFSRGFRTYSAAS